MSTIRPMPGGPLLRASPAGLVAGAALSRVDGPGAALRLVGEELARAEAELSLLVQSDVAAIPAVAGYLLDAGGKRLRPALTALGARAVHLEAPVHRLMCVGELLHLGSLLHDDVVDDGLLRRGRPAAHRVHGNAVTVLTGDYCLARAMLLGAVEGGHVAVTELSRTVTEMAEGEVLQLKHAGDLSCTFEQYLDVVDRKSAALISWCCAAPAWAAGDEHAASALARFGRGVGKAFQLTDDVLDYAQGTGKLAGADLRERKVTLPLLEAMERLPGLREELKEGAPSSERLQELMGLIQGSGALEAALHTAHTYVQGAMSALEELPPSEGRDGLQALGLYLVERSR